MAQKREPVRSRDVQGLKYLDKLLWAELDEVTEHLAKLQPAAI